MDNSSEIFFEVNEGLCECVLICGYDFLFRYSDEEA